MDKKPCNNCIHKDVCAYKDIYDEVIEFYEDLRKEARKNPYIKISFDCSKHKPETYIK